MHATFSKVPNEELGSELEPRGVAYRIRTEVHTHKLVY
jgi:hypothetical protein